MLAPVGHRKRELKQSLQRLAVVSGLFRSGQKNQLYSQASFVG